MSEKAQVEVKSGGVKAPAWSSTLLPSSPPPSRGCSDRMEEHSSSASRSLKPISALGCRPNASGQGLALVHCLAELKRFLWDKGCV